MYYLSKFRQHWAYILRNTGIYNCQCCWRKFVHSCVPLCCIHLRLQVEQLINYKLILLINKHFLSQHVHAYGENLRDEGPKIVLGPQS